MVPRFDLRDDLFDRSHRHAPIVGTPYLDGRHVGFAFQNNGFLSKPRAGVIDPHPGITEFGYDPLNIRHGAVEPAQVSDIASRLSQIRYLIDLSNKGFLALLSVPSVVQTFCDGLQQSRAITLF